MNCLDFRRIRLSDPYSADEALTLHRSECSGCRAFEAEIRNLDRKIARAFTVEVPEGLAARILLNRSLQSRSRRPSPVQWLSLAASVLLAASALVFWSTTNVTPAHALVQHLEMEQPAIDSILMPVHEPQLRQVLNSVNLDAVGPLGDVVFASTCIIDGELVAHLVIRDGRNHYTLLLAPTRITEQEVEFDQDHWRGLIAAGDVAPGVAVLAREETGTDFASMHAVVQQVNRSLTQLDA